MKIEPGKQVTYTMDNLAFGCIPQDELLKEFASGRIIGVLLERDLAHRFENLSKENCTQGSGEDLRVNGKTGQCKTVRLGKSVKKGGKVNYNSEIGWTTKSGLWDSQRGKKRKWDEWDAEHHAYMQKFDYFIYIDIDNFPQVTVLLVESTKLANRPEAKSQGESYHYGKRKSKAPDYPVPEWQFPISITRQMWEDFSK